MREVEHDRYTIGLEAIVASLQADRRAAVRDGYSELSATVEMSWVLTRPGEMGSVLRYERDVRRVFAAADIAGVCQSARARA